MKKAEHLSEDQFHRYRHRTLAPGELLEVDRHIAQCETCLARLWRESDAIPPLQGLRNQLSEHLNYEQIVACAEGAAAGPCERHLAECELCRAEVDELRDFREQWDAPRRSAPVIAMPVPGKPRRTGALAAIAAATVLAAGLGFWALRMQPAAAPAPEISKTNPIPEPTLSPEQQALVQLAITSQKFAPAPVLDGLIARRGVLLGSPGETRTFEIGGPAGTTVLTDRPTFRWQAMEGASRYVVSVFDADFRKVAESPHLATSLWQPEQPLARDRVYNWQVTATAGGTTFRSPVPPAPEARFQVVSAAGALSIETARREHPGNHLLLAVLLANLGALDDAAAELDALAATDSRMAGALRESLDRLRKP